MPTQACWPKRCEEKREREYMGEREQESGREGEQGNRREREREGKAGERPLALLAPLSMFFSPPPGLPYVKWASQECCLFYLRSSLQFLDFPLFYFHGLFPFLSFSHHHSGLLFPILITWHSPLKRWEAQFFGNRGVKVFLATSC